MFVSFITRLIRLALVLVVAALVAMVWCLLPSREPVYKGRKLGEWMADYDRPTVHGRGRFPETDDAIRQIGTNAIPTLLQMIDAEGSPWKRKFFTWARARGFKISAKDATVMNNEAVDAFHALGTNGGPAVPGLINIYRWSKTTTVRQSVVLALERIGPPSQAAMPVLLSATTNIHTAPFAANALLRAHCPPDVVVPALCRMLRDPEMTVTGGDSAAIEALGTMGLRARAAIPDLREALTNGNPRLRGNILAALQAIETAPDTKAEVK